MNAARKADLSVHWYASGRDTASERDDSESSIMTVGGKSLRHVPSLPESANIVLSPIRADNPSDPTV
jgi:hypothetical protein